MPNVEVEIPIPYEVRLRHPNGYFLEAEGTCMNKIYTEGSLIYIDPEKPPINGSVAVVSIDGQDYIMRRFFKGANTLILSPESYDETWTDIIITPDQSVEYRGLVVWYQAPRELPS